MATADLTVIALGRPVKLDERRDRPDQTLVEKVESVERLLASSE